MFYVIYFNSDFSVTENVSQEVCRESVNFEFFEWAETEVKKVGSGTKFYTLS